jgi:hypothetical protein
MLKNISKPKKALLYCLVVSVTILSGCTTSTVQPEPTHKGSERLDTIKKADKAWKTEEARKADAAKRAENAWKTEEARKAEGAKRAIKAWETEETRRAKATKPTLTGTLKGFQSQQVHVISVAAGKTLSVKQIGAKNEVTLSISNPSGTNVSDLDASCNNHLSVSPTVAGNYKVTVVECRKANSWNGSYTLNVSVK